MLFKDNKHFVPCIGIIDLSSVQVTSDIDLNSPVKSIQVSSDNKGGFTGVLILASTKQINFKIDPFIYDANSALYTKIRQGGDDYYVTCGLYAFIMGYVHKLIMDAKVATASDTDKYVLALSRDRLTGIIEQLKSHTLLQLSVVTNVFCITSNNLYGTSSTFLKTLFDGINFDKKAFSHRGHILTVLSNSEYADAFNSAVNSNADIRSIKNDLLNMIVLPSELKYNLASDIPAKILARRKALEYAFSQMLVFDVWPSEMSLSTFDSMPPYIKGRLYKLALDNRSNVQSVVTQGQHESMSSFFINDHPSLASFLSNAIYPLSDTDKVNGRMSYIESVLLASNKDDISDLFDSRITTGTMNAIKSEIRALGIFISTVLCDAGSISIGSNGNASFTIPVYDSSFLTYYQNGLVKISYRS